MIRDKIVCGIRDNGLRKSLLEDTKLTLKKCVERCKAVESSGQQAQNIVKTRQDTCQDQPLSLNHVRTRAAQRPPLQSVRGQLREQRLPAGAGPHGGSTCRDVGDAAGHMNNSHVPRLGNNAGGAEAGTTSLLCAHVQSSHR